MAKTNKIAIISVMLCFFCMGFVDLVGIASNYVKADLGLTDKVANTLPSLVFFWFLIFSVPTGMLMNKIGRKKTVLLSLVVTIISLFIPLFGNSFPVMLIAFSLLGIGNALMQTSLNPLVSTVMGGGNLASTLTFGQFIKAIASFIAPYLASWGALQVIPSLGLNWRVLFAIFFVIGTFSTVLLAVRHLLCSRYLLNGSAGCHPHPRGKNRGQAFDLCGVLQALGHAHRAALVPGYHVPCGHRCGYQHHRPQDSHGASGHELERRRICCLALFHLPYHRLLDRFVLPARTQDENVFHHQRHHDGPVDVRYVLRSREVDPVHRYRSRGLR